MHTAQRGAAPTRPRSRRAQRGSPRCAAAAEHEHAPPSPGATAAKPAHGHGHGSASAVASTGFVGEMRKVAMKLHTREQAPKEGEAKPAEKAKPMAQWKPTLATYAAYLAESKALFDAIEALIATSADPSLAPFRASGLERGPALAADIEALRLRGVEPPSHPAPAAAPGPGAAYAAHLASLASRDVPAFICHFYNVYFAHTAGGAMIGRSLTAALDLPPQRFWSYDGVDLAGSMDGVRGKINAAAEEWSEEQRQHCLAETGRSFEMSGKLLRLLVAPEPAAAAV